MDNYFTIKEFADIVGISTQAVYQRLDKDLKDYYNVIDGKKYLDKNVLSLFKDTIQKNDGENGFDMNSYLQTENDTLNRKVKALQDTISNKEQELLQLKQDSQELTNKLTTLSEQMEAIKRDNIIKDNKISELITEKQSIQDALSEAINKNEKLKHHEDTIAQLQNNLDKALKSTAELEQQLSTERSTLTERDSQILNKEKRLDEKENTIQQLLAQLQQAQQHSEYMSKQLAKANETLSETTFKAQELTQNQQILMKQQQDNQILLTSSQHNKQSLLEKIFGKK